MKTEKYGMQGYNAEYFPHPGGVVFGDGEENQRMEKKKKKILEDFTLFVIAKDSIWLQQHYFTLF